jgi:hypothetical protein
MSYWIRPKPPTNTQINLDPNTPIHCGSEKKKAMLGRKATNNESKSALGGATVQVQEYG